MSNSYIKEHSLSVLLPVKLRASDSLYAQIVEFL
jgi:hypothetical protein